MQFDAKTIAPDDTIETDLCVIGAGPAGLAIASAFVGAKTDVVLLESGGAVAEPGASALNDGDIIGDAYAGLTATRHRQIGGTAAIWNTRTAHGVGAKFTPLGRIDLESRQAGALSGWPMEFEELLPWYTRAHAMAGLGPLAYDASRWSGDGREPLGELGPDIESAVYQFGSRDALLGPMLRAIRVASNVRMVSHATVVRLETDAADREVRRVEIRSPGGGTWRVAARQFVLCGGAIENARLLLCSGRTAESLGNRSGWVGRCFMEHPRDRSLVLHSLPRTAFARLRFYDLQEHAGRALVAGRLTIADAAVHAGGLLSAAATLLPVVRESVRTLREALGPFGRGPLAERWLPRGGHGWSRHPAPSVAFEGFTVLLNLEQAPDPENRIVLGRRRDTLGIPVPELRWRWRPRDEHSRQSVRSLFANALARSGIGIVRHREVPLDPNAHHHAGTTRMHTDPRYGVVDPAGKVHGVENLYVGGASTFPTAGFANPALTILALALRLAEHLKVRV
jgi:choline dehydrogenase-like flavoprotein